MPLKEKIEKAKPALRAAIGEKNDLALPQLVKVVVSSGTGKAKDKKRNELVADRLSKITGQKAALRGAKQSIATFKSRQGDIIGVAVTLRGPRMYQFLDKLINIAMPRMRDFKGYTPSSIDDMGNLTIGIREHIVFPETIDEEIKDVFGMSVTIVTTAQNKKDALEFFKQMGFPFRKSM